MSDVLGFSGSGKREGEGVSSQERDDGRDGLLGLFNGALMDCERYRHSVLHG